MIGSLQALVLFCTAPVVPAKAWTGETDDIRYLVIRRAGKGKPEKNYYELAKHVLIHGVFWSDERHRTNPAPTFMADQVETFEPDGYRYDVHSIWKVRVRRITDSQADPVSARDGTYVLIYLRDPDTRFCGLRYEVRKLPTGARHVDYTDCEDKKQYSFEMTKNWPRPFVVYEVEIVDRDSLHDLWQRQVQARPH